MADSTMADRVLRSEDVTESLRMACALLSEVITAVAALLMWLYSQRATSFVEKVNDGGQCVINLTFIDGVTFIIVVTTISI